MPALRHWPGRRPPPRHCTILESFLSEGSKGLCLPFLVNKSESILVWFYRIFTFIIVFITGLELVTCTSWCPATKVLQHHRKTSKCHIQSSHFWVMFWMCGSLLNFDCTVSLQLHGKRVCPEDHWQGQVCWKGKGEANLIMWWNHC